MDYNLRAIHRVSIIGINKSPRCNIIMCHIII